MRIAPTKLILATAVLGVSLLGGCGPTRQEVNELRDQQKQILAKIEELSKKIDQARAAAPAQRAASGPDPEKVYTLAVGKSPVKGPAAAPVSIVEFSDYQCPFCARSEPLILDALKQYPDKVNFVYKHFPLTSIHPHAWGAANAAAAAQKQGKFWEMHEVLFANQKALDPTKLKDYAQQIGLDVQRFESDMNSDEVKAAVREDVQQAQTLQIRGTPTIFVNGKLLQQRTSDGLKQVIEDQLKQKSAG
jgi:protein-disulfide isomerase